MNNGPSTIHIFSILVVSLSLIGCDVDNQISSKGNETSSRTTNPESDYVLSAFAEADTTDFLRGLEGKNVALLIPEIRDRSWLKGDMAITTEVQAVHSGQIKLYLNEATRKIAPNLIERFQQNKISSEDFYSAIQAVDAVYASIIASHSSIHNPDLDRSRSPLVFACLDRATLSELLRSSNLENPPLTAAECRALVIAARESDFENASKIGR